MKLKRVSPYVWIATFIAAAAAVALLFADRRDAVTRTEPASQVPPVMAQPKSEDRTAKQAAAEKSGFVGTLLARESVDVASKFEGRLEAVNAALGDRVARNSIVAKLDSESIKRELSIAEASLRVAQAERRKAELSLSEAKERHERRVFLANNGIFSKEQLKDTQYQVELAAAALDVAQARIDEQTASIEQLKDRLANTEIRSPFEGIVSARHQNPGAVVGSGTPIVSLIRAGELWVRFAVPAERAGLVKIGSPVNVDIEILKISASGVVENISPGVDSALQMLMVEAKLKIPGKLKNQIKPGLTARVSLF